MGFHVTNISNKMSHARFDSTGGSAQLDPARQIQDSIVSGHFTRIKSSRARKQWKLLTFLGVNGRLSPLGSYFRTLLHHIAFAPLPIDFPIFWYHLVTSTIVRCKSLRSTDSPEWFLSLFPAKTIFLALFGGKLLCCEYFSNLKRYS